MPQGKKKLTTQTPMTSFEGEGRNVKRLSGKTYLQFSDRRPSVKLEPLLINWQQIKLCISV